VSAFPDRIEATLDAYAQQLLPQLPGCFPGFVAVFAFESHVVGGALLPLRQETDAALRACEILDDSLFREHVHCPVLRHVSSTAAGPKLANERAKERVGTGNHRYDAARQLIQAIGGDGEPSHDEKERVEKNNSGKGTGALVPRIGVCANGRGER
jgi:hypothetical protein